MDKIAATFELWSLGHKSLSKSLKISNLTQDDYERIFGSKVEESIISSIVSKGLKGHTGELLGKDNYLLEVYYCFKHIILISKSIFIYFFINVFQVKDKNSVISIL